MFYDQQFRFGPDPSHVATIRWYPAAEGAAELQQETSIWPLSWDPFPWQATTPGEVMLQEDQEWPGAHAANWNKPPRPPNKAPKLPGLLGQDTHGPADWWVTGIPAGVTPEPTPRSDHGPPVSCLPDAWGAGAGGDWDESEDNWGAGAGGPEWGVLQPLCHTYIMDTTTILVRDNGGIPGNWNDDNFFYEMFTIVELNGDRYWRIEGVFAGGRWETPNWDGFGCQQFTPMPGTPGGPIPVCCGEPG